MALPDTGGRIVKVLKVAVEEFGELVKGEDPLRTEGVIAKMRTASAAAGPGGLSTLAMAAIDIALWDIRGKALRRARCASSWAPRANKVPAYASGALVRTSPLPALEKAAAALVKKGYTQMKTQMAVEGLSPAQEIERIRAIRNAAGPEVELMVDINQRWGVHQAISIGRQIEDLQTLLARRPDRRRRLSRRRGNRPRTRLCRSAPANISTASRRTGRRWRIIRWTLS